jgi:hypothetical protein
MYEKEVKLIVAGTIFMSNQAKPPDTVLKPEEIAVVEGITKYLQEMFPK